MPITQLRYDIQLAILLYSFMGISILLFQAIDCKVANVNKRHKTGEEQFKHLEMCQSKALSCNCLAGVLLKKIK